MFERGLKSHPCLILYIFLQERMTDVAPEKWSADSLCKLPVVIFWMIKTSDFCFPFSLGREERELDLLWGAGQIPLRSFVRSFRERAQPCDSHRIVIRAFINYCWTSSTSDFHCEQKDHHSLIARLESFLNKNRIFCCCND